MTCILAASLVLVLAAVPSSNAADGTAVTSFGRCMQSADSASIVVLMDKSRSLKGSDETGLRFDGLKAVVAGLTRLSSDTGVPMEMLLASFAGSVDPDPDSESPGWFQLSDASLDQQLQKVESERSVDLKSNTDYAAALSAADRFLKDKAEERARRNLGDDCQAILFFTDGSYTIVDSDAGDVVSAPPYASDIDMTKEGSGAAAVRIGRRYLCRDGGLMDQLREGDVTVFTVGLTGGMSPSDESFLNALTDGSGGACGARSGTAYGQFIDVTKAEDLYFGFGDLLSGGRVAPRRGPGGFSAVPGMRRFTIRILADEGRGAIVLVGPRGTRRELKSDEGTKSMIDGTSVTLRPISGRAFEVTGDFTRGEDWTGRWEYSFTGFGSTQPLVQLQLFAEVTPMLVGSPVLERGATSRIEFQLMDGDGKPVTGGPLERAAELSAAVTYPSSGEPDEAAVRRASEPGRFVATLPVPLGEKATSAFLDATVTFNVGGDVKLEPSRASYRLPIKLPDRDGFPHVTPANLELLPIELEKSDDGNRGSAAGTLTLVASRSSSGCVKFGRPVLGTVQDEATAELVTSVTRDDGCIPVQKGQSREIGFTLKLKNSQSGKLAFTVPVELHSDLVNRSESVELPGTARVLPPSNVPLRWLIVAGFVALGLLIPLAILAGLNFLLGKFPEPRRLKYSVYKVRLEKGGKFMVEGEPLAPNYIEDFEKVSTAGNIPGSRRLDIGDFAFVSEWLGNRRDRTLTLFSGAHGVVTSGNSHVVSGATSARTHKRRRMGAAAEIPQALAGNWVFALSSHEILQSTRLQARGERDGSGEAVDGSLLIVLPDVRGAGMLPDLIRSAEAALNKLVWSDEFPPLASSEGSSESVPLSGRKQTKSRKTNDTSTPPVTGLRRGGRRESATAPPGTPPPTVNRQSASTDDPVAPPTPTEPSDSPPMPDSRTNIPAPPVARLRSRRNNETDKP